MKQTIRVLKLLAFPPMALLEGILLILCILLLHPFPSAAEKIVVFAMDKLPDPGWYLGGEYTKPQPIEMRQDK